VTNIAIATPAYGETFYAPYVKSIIGLQRLIEQRRWGSSFTTISYADVVEARNYLLSLWFDQSKATHLLFVDADMGFEPALVSDMIAFDKPIVGVIYPKRNVNLDRIVTLAAKGVSAEVAIARGHDFIYRPLAGQTPRQEKGFLEVEGCGTGLLLIRRDCIAQMLKKLPEIVDRRSKIPKIIEKDLNRLIRAFDNVHVDGRRLSEDYSFCHRWRRLCGGEIWANVSHVITHIGLRRFDAKFTSAGKAPRVVINTSKLKGTPGQAAGSQRGVGNTVVGQIKTRLGNKPIKPL
jgi:hypothetical protein